jgi:hypothetical protein
MKVCETIQQSLQHVKTSLGTAADKTSATVKKASQIALTILKVLFTPITYLCTRAKSFFDKKHEQPSRGREASAQGGSPAILPVDQDGDSTDSAIGSAIRSIPVDQDGDSTDFAIGSAIRSIPEGDSYQAASAQGGSLASLPVDQDGDSKKKAEAQIIAVSLVETILSQAAHQCSASLPVDQDGDTKKKAEAQIIAVSLVETLSQAARQCSASLPVDQDGDSMDSAIGSTIRSIFEGDSYQVDDSFQGENSASRELKAVKIQKLFRGHTGRKAHRAQSVKEAQTKAEANIAAAGFLKNVVGGAVLRYGNLKRFDHRVPAATGASRVVEKFSPVWKVGVLPSIIQGGSAAEWPLPTSERANKSQKRRPDSGKAPNT